MSGPATGPAVLVYNEQTKLLANALDRASTALGAGSVFPLINAWQASQGQTAGSRVWLFAASAYIFLFCALLLHLAARRVLKVLR
jgi:hypothetical protein